MQNQVVIGVPIFNAGPFLRAALQSIANQSFCDFRALLVDDGSQDDSLAIVQEFLDDHRFILVSDGQRRGLASRLNQIAGMAESEFLFRMDADDVMHPARVQRQLEMLTSSDRWDFVASSVWIIDTHNDVIGKRVSNIDSVATSADVLRRGAGVAHPTVAGRTEWFQRNRYSAENLRTEDLELWVRTFDGARFKILPDPLLFYRQEASFDSVRYRLAMSETRALLWKYGPSQIGRTRTLHQMGTTLARTAAARVADSLNLGDLILARRNSGISAEERREATRILENAMRGR